MPTWQSVAVRLLEDPPLPKKTFLFNAQDNAYLEELAKVLSTNQADAVRRAVRNLVFTLRRGDAMYVTDTTTTPSPAAGGPLRLVEKAHGSRRTPPAKAPANTKRRKK
jgi:hypothetical protein